LASSKVMPVLLAARYARRSAIQFMVSASTTFGSMPSSTWSGYPHTASDVLIGGSLGCLCKIPQKYLKGGPTRWQHCVTVFEFDTVTGEFWFTPIRINDGRLIYNGRVFGG